MDEYAFTAGEKALLVGFFLVGLLLFVTAIIWKHRLEKYEFENRTDGGVVEFASYGSSLRHSLKRKIMSLMGVVGFIATGLGLWIVIVAFKQ